MNKLLFLLLLLKSSATFCMEKKDTYSDIWEQLCVIYTTPESEYGNPAQTEAGNRARILVENQLLSEESQKDPILWAIAAALFPEDPDKVIYCSQRAVNLMKAHTPESRKRSNTLTLHERAKNTSQQSCSLLDSLDAIKSDDPIHALYPKEKRKEILIQFIKTSIVQAAIEVYQETKPTPPKRTLIAKLLNNG